MTFNDDILYKLGEYGRVSYCVIDAVVSVY